MALEAQNNPFPSVLFVETVDPATPAADTGRLFLDTDGILKWISDAAVVTEITSSVSAAAHIADTSAAHAASAVAFTPNGSIAATDVQAAIQEVRDEATGAGLTDHTHAVTGSGATGGGATLEPTSLNATGLVMHSGRTTATIDADQNDYSPTNLHSIGILYLNSFTANRTFTGINAGTEGEQLVVQNNTAFSLLLAHESASSSASNRFRCANAATVTIRQRGSVLLVYVQGRWCPMVI